MAVFEDNYRKFQAVHQELMRTIGQVVEIKADGTVVPRPGATVQQVKEAIETAKKITQKYNEITQLSVETSQELAEHEKEVQEIHEDLKKSPLYSNYAKKPMLRALLGIK